ncbi:methyltransferase [Marinospirillum sp.]|uniref:methyltransferase n=1 Tax=Marinospirillum sp. TaxID=2183934 RepID=UPI003A8AA067
MSSSYCDLNAFLQRHRERWQQPLCLLAPPAELQLSALSAPVALSLSADWRQVLQAQQQGIAAQLVGETFDPLSTPSHPLLFWPKAKEEGFWWLEQALAHWPSLDLVGDNHSGLKAVAKNLAQAGLSIHKVDTAKRTSLYRLQLSDQPTQDLALIRTLAPVAKATQWQTEDQLTLISRPGVFSHGRLDEGSALLLEVWRERLQEPTSQQLGQARPKQLLDLGCGCGLLGGWLLKHYASAAQLCATDVNGLALAATQATLAANGLQGEVLPSDIYSSLDGRRFDWIVSNPPFHTGQRTDYSLAERLIREAPQHLHPQGELWLVANRFLPWPELLEASFGQYQEYAQDGRYAVYWARGGQIR